MASAFGACAQSTGANSNTMCTVTSMLEQHCVHVFWWKGCAVGLLQRAVKQSVDTAGRLQVGLLAILFSLGLTLFEGLLAGLNSRPPMASAAHAFLPGMNHVLNPIWHLFVSARICSCLQHRRCACGIHLLMHCTPTRCCSTCYAALYLGSGFRVLESTHSVTSPGKCI